MKCLGGANHSGKYRRTRAERERPDTWVNKRFNSKFGIFYLKYSYMLYNIFLPVDSIQCCRRWRDRRRAAGVRWQHRRRRRKSPEEEVKFILYHIKEILTLLYH